MKNLLWGLILGAGLAQLYSMSFADALEAEKVYCKYVDEKTWPDYKGLTHKCLELKENDSH